jgi:hypothetical protein
MSPYTNKSIKIPGNTEIYSKQNHCKIGKKASQTDGVKKVTKFFTFISMFPLKDRKKKLALNTDLNRASTSRKYESAV